jgi:hypothetical protein
MRWDSGVRRILRAPTIAVDNKHTGWYVNRGRPAADATINEAGLREPVRALA